MNAISIRTATTEDFPQLIALFKEFATFQKTPERMTNTVAQMEAEKDHFHGFVAVNESGSIVGYVTWFFTFHTWTGKCLYMDDLYVTETYRKQGLGRQLLDKVIAQGKTTHCHSLRWLVSEWNTNAQEFYKSLGASLDHTEMHCELSLL